MRRIYLLPNLFTTASLFCGLLAILNVFNVAVADEPETYKYTVSCWLILLAAVLDLLDGWIARMTRSESAFGAQYDSLADVIAFGVAPAILIYTRMVNMHNRHAAEVITTLYAICGALRLARFNVQKAKIEKKSFTGLPIPAAAGMVVSSFLFFERIDPEWNKAFVLSVLPFIMVGLSYLMVSTINYPSFKQLELEKRKTFDVLPPIAITLIAVIAFWKEYYESFAFFGFAAYILLGLFQRCYELLVRKKPPVQPSEDLGKQS